MRDGYFGVNEIFESCICAKSLDALLEGYGIMKKRYMVNKILRGITFG